MIEDVDARIAELGDWRGETLGRLRKLIHEADPGVTEAIKWRKPSNPAGVPVWEHDGLICTGETYKDKVKLTFAQGASIDDPAKLFNSSLDAGTGRSISVKATRSTPRRSRRSSAPLLLLTAPKRSAVERTAKRQIDGMAHPRGFEPLTSAFGGL